MNGHADTAPPVIHAPNLEDQKGVVHGFFTRRGGTSSGLYASLNAGPGSGDDRDRVAANRDRAAAALGLGPGRIVTAYQVHSADVAEVEAPWDMADAPRVDGLVTRVPGVGLGVLAADCAPVLMADAEAGVVGAAHAGWRGALNGVIEATVAAMEGLGADRSRIGAAIGPCIGRESYEVGPEFPAPFIAASPANEVFFRAAPRPDHYLFDLGGFVAARLSDAGLKPVPPPAEDTCAEAERFFSYRRSVLNGEPDYGRNLSVIALSAE
ncbi:MAG TPA: peptidoglycan editing factor PgeF [Alphaproteobacteria bacterium]|nr:peptidoglycan editing factor PgeF [Alphaproteobacteria bacterium]